MLLGGAEASLSVVVDAVVSQTVRAGGGLVACAGLLSASCLGCVLEVAVGVGVARWGDAGVTCVGVAPLGGALGALLRGWRRTHLNLFSTALTLSPSPKAAAPASPIWFQLMFKFFNTALTS